MSDPRAIPDDERPMIPEELVPRQESDDPMRADGAEGMPDAGKNEDGDDAIEVEDLP